MRHQDTERRRPQNRHPDYIFAADTVADRPSHQCAGRRIQQKDKQKNLRLLYTDDELVHQVESVIAAQAGHINVFRKDKRQQDGDRKKCPPVRKRHGGMPDSIGRAPFDTPQISLVPTANRDHHQNRDKRHDCKVGDVVPPVRSDQQRHQ